MPFHSHSALLFQCASEICIILKLDKLTLPEALVLKSFKHSCMKIIFIANIKIYAIYSNRNLQNGAQNHYPSING